MQQETIAAIVTAMGESSVGIVRLSGDKAVEIAQNVFISKIPLTQAPSHTIHYGKVIENGNVIDEALAMIMRAPKSFTGEDVVELQCHGGPIVMDKVLKAVLKAGARMAQQGEYSKRAFLNGKMDLSQAEAIMDIVSAKSESGLEMALEQRFGRLSGEIQDLRSQLVELIAFMQADIDYPEDDIERYTEEEYREKITALLNRVQRLGASYQEGKIYKEGLKVVLAGKPNVGKSSLLNALLKEDRAIVTDIAGTTRDVIEEYINLAGIPIRLIDTAGIRESGDVVEKIGVEKSLKRLEEADLVLYLYEPLEGLVKEDEEILAQIAHKEIIFLRNKSDLNHSIDEKEQSVIQGRTCLEISALYYDGLEQLSNEIRKKFFHGEIKMDQGGMLNNLRHYEAVTKAEAHLVSCLQGLEMGMTNDFLVIDLNNAWEWLGMISGETVDEDLLDIIFSRFCLGK